MFDFLAESLAGDQISVESGSIENSIGSSIYWHRPEAGIIVFEPIQMRNNATDIKLDRNVVISCAVHGNETAPVEITSELVQGLLNGQYRLNVRLMVILGNLDAMRIGERYLNIDLNRLFNQAHSKYPQNSETTRAAKLESLVAKFYQEKPEFSHWHFDLHTAIKPSRHIRFGLLPYVESGQYSPTMMQWLQNVGLEALVINHAPASTFSYFTSHQFHAASCTLELGKALHFGCNDLSQFKGIRSGLLALMANELSHSEGEQTSNSKNNQPNQTSPILYKVSQQITKISEQFQFNIDENSHNFTKFRQGTLLASDKNTLYMVKEESEYLLFPNSGVKTGFRAGLMLKQVES
ncbi:succinylglutamate desuccinylase [Vibrio sp. S17_S38]|uniref:succinylglutamate desuccinylase n=1 Tax=Vibrio sp. S17_S38 TaxID=2720229 RepID=UPI001680B51D|nr:succinylglutamate desuccinylase [Vibrio sp. S17_S38]MBD1572156.1 succinylglutamate desuccinylase [Vibrio sp. S17_S38]